MSKIRVMVVDDTSDDLMLFQRAVSKNDTLREIKLVEVRSAESALAEIAMPNVLPDLLFVDLHLGIMSGLDLLKELKASERTRHIPVIITSRNEGSVSIMDAMREGASSYVFKDFDDEDYYSNLRAIIVYWVDYHKVPNNRKVVPL